MNPAIHPMQAPAAVVMVRPRHFHPNPQTRAEVQARLEESGRSVIALSARQITEFTANALELSGSQGHVLAISTHASLDA